MNNLNLLETVLAVVLLSGAMWKGCEWAWNYLAASKEPERDCYSDPARPRMVARSAHASTAPTVRDLPSVGRAVATARDSHARPFHFPAESQAREKPAGRLDRDSGYPSETVRLRMQPKGDAA